MNINILIILLLWSTITATASDNYFTVTEKELTINSEYKILFSDSILNHSTDSDNVYISTKDYIYSINKSDGQIQYKINIPGHKSMSVSDNYIYTFTLLKIYKINKINGTIDTVRYKTISELFVDNPVSGMGVTNNYTNNYYNYTNGTTSDNSKLNKSGDIYSEALYSSPVIYSSSNNNIRIKLIDDPDDGTFLYHIFSGKGDDQHSDLSVSDSGIVGSYFSVPSQPSNAGFSVNWEGVTLRDDSKSDGYGCWLAGYFRSCSTNNTDNTKVNKSGDTNISGIFYRSYNSGIINNQNWINISTDTNCNNYQILYSGDYLIQNSTFTNVQTYMYINGDLNNSNYTVQYINAVGTAVVGGHVGVPLFIGLAVGNAASMNGYLSTDFAKKFTRFRGSGSRYGSTNIEILDTSSIHSSPELNSLNFTILQGINFQNTSIQVMCLQ